VSRTAAGDAAAAAASTAIAEIERQWRSELGADRFDVMMQALRDLGRDAIAAPGLGQAARGRTAG
jgi:hypothetical protein